jgi:hypothetical protein
MPLADKNTGVVNGLGQPKLENLKKKSYKLNIF